MNKSEDTERKVATEHGLLVQVSCVLLLAVAFVCNIGGMDAESHVRFFVGKGVTGTTQAPP